MNVYYNEANLLESSTIWDEFTKVAKVTLIPHQMIKENTTSKYLLLETCSMLQEKSQRLTQDAKPLSKENLNSSKV